MSNLYLLDEIGLLIVELLVVGAIRVEAGEELDEFLAIPQENLRDRLRLIGIRHEHLNPREGLLQGKERGGTLNTWKASN
jgi:hypothetical protein